MAKPFGYSLSMYGDMIESAPRMSAYDAALQKAVQPGMVVLDIGAGTGIFSLLACRYGARHVYAIEPDDSIQLARQIAHANGMADRITFIQDISTRVTLPERADLLVCDLRGILPIFEQNIPSIMDARARLLKPGGVQIPLRDIIYAAPVESASTYAEYAEPWTSGYQGLKLSAARQNVLNSWSHAQVESTELLAAPHLWTTLDYTAITDTDAQGELRWRAARAGTLHGVVVWFDAVLAEGIGYTNAPGMPRVIHSKAFFPVLQPVSVAEGDLIAVMLSASLTGAEYTWHWRTAIWDQSQPPQVKAQFNQSTFFSAPLTAAELRKLESGFVPALTAEGELDRAFLTLADGNTPLGDIAEQLQQRFPQRFTTTKDALTYVGEMAQRYSDV